MWNNLKSDLYRMLHTKMFYIVLALSITAYIMLLCEIGLSSNSDIATFSRSQNTFMDFLYYMPKSGIMVMLLLIFIALFTVDEYNTGFIKNTFPIQMQKWKIILERYCFSVLVIFVILSVNVIVASLVQIIYPLELGNVDLASYLLYLLAQIFFIACIGSIANMLIHLTRSKVIAIIFAVIYPMQLIYMLVVSVTTYLMPNTQLYTYMLYDAFGKLPYTFSWTEYQKPLCLLIVFTLLYNGISYMLIKKKDMQ